MKEKLAIDSSVLIKVLLENKKEIILSLVPDYELFVSSNVLEETAYKIISLTVSDIIHSKKFHKVNLSKRISFELKLLTNDALIAAACKHHGIRKIATFDSDFKRVEFLEVIELEE